MKNSLHENSQFTCLIRGERQINHIATSPNNSKIVNRFAHTKNRGSINITNVQSSMISNFKLHNLKCQISPIHGHASTNSCHAKAWQIKRELQPQEYEHKYKGNMWKMACKRERLPLIILLQGQKLAS